MNDEQLVTDIRRAFGRYHSEAQPIESPAGAAAAVAPTPMAGTLRTPLLARRRLLGGLSFAGVAAAVALAVAFALGIAPAGRPPQSVWAAWQSVPTVPDETLREAAPNRCAQQLHIQPADQFAGSSLSYGDLKLIAQDQRGPAAMFMFARGTDLWACMVWPNAYGTYDAMGLGLASEAHPLPCHLEWMVEGGAVQARGTPTDTDPLLVTIFGRTDADTVLVHKSDGTQVQATVSDGVFVAWWPGGGEPAGVVAYDAGGHVLQALGRMSDPQICQVPASPASPLS